EPAADTELGDEARHAVAQHRGPVGVRDVAEGSRALPEVEPCPEPGSAHLGARELELEPAELLEDRPTYAPSPPCVDQVGRGAIQPVHPSALAEGEEHQAKEAELVAHRHREAQEPRRTAEVIELPTHPEEHADPAPPDVGQRPDELEEEEEGAVAVQDVMVAKGIEVPVALKAAGEPAETLAPFDQRDVVHPGPRQGVRRRDAREPAPQDHHRRVLHLTLPSLGRNLPTRRRRARIVALSLFAVAALLRVVLVLRPGLWVDEVFSLAMGTGHSLEHPARDADPARGDYVEPSQAVPAAALRRYLEHESPPAGVRRVIRAVFLSDTSPPLYYLLLNLWTRIAGTSDAALRLFSAFSALAAFPLLWAVGRKLGGVRTAWTACLLFTLAPAALYYSGEGRMYSLLSFLGLALAWSTLALAQRGTRPALIVLWIIAGAAGLLAHYFFLFVWLACLAWLGLQPGRMSRAGLAGAGAMTGLLVLPWYL